MCRRNNKLVRPAWSRSICLVTLSVWMPTYIVIPTATFAEASFWIELINLKQKERNDISYQCSGYYSKYLLFSFSNLAPLNSKKETSFILFLILNDYCHRMFKYLQIFLCHDNERRNRIHKYSKISFFSKLISHFKMQLTNFIYFNHIVYSFFYSIPMVCLCL